MWHVDDNGMNESTANLMPWHSKMQYEQIAAFCDYLICKIVPSSQHIYSDKNSISD